MDSEHCFELKYHLQKARQDNLKRVELVRAVPEKVPGYFWCKFYETAGETGTCGRECEDYAPRNGKSGACRYYSNVFYKHGETEIFEL